MAEPTLRQQRDALLVHLTDCDTHEMDLARVVYTLPRELPLAQLERWHATDHRRRPAETRHDHPPVIEAPAAAPPAGGPGRGRMPEIPAELARRIVAMAEAGTSENAIAGTLNREGVPTARGGTWRHNTVARVLARARRSTTAP
jgi:hypothetical protein